MNENEKSSRFFWRKKNTFISGEQFLNWKIEKLPWYQILFLYKKKSILQIFIGALIFNFAIVLFLSRAATIPSGVTGIPTTLMLIYPFLAKYFSLFYFGLNLPLIIFYFKKVKKSFMLLTIVFMLFNFVINSIINIDLINNFLKKYIDLADGWTIEKLTNEKTSTVINNAEVQFTKSYATWPIIIYSIIGSIFMGVSNAFIWRAGGSSGGTDIVVYYVSIKKKKSIGNITLIFAIATSSIYTIIYIPLVKPKYYVMQMIGSFSYIVIVSLVVNILYPKYKKVKLSISTTNLAKIQEYFKEVKYWHPYKIIVGISGYTGRKIYKIETVVLFIESKILVNDIKHYEPHAWIEQVGPVNVFGRFNTNMVD
ncbi:YitT family protein [Mycoplasmopsis pulmonis]|uniref:YitT family protein n=1 Tax=Mycoplasmopsis pulmonis TaxID=2107 RepID=UPI001005160E|nr:YitT family protein [Mycoplasmopsis pulmonis]MDZ7293080.1 YitT family protein [Mycoplasmopsis pulmonis]VEU67873.1 Uncharacterized BCR, YitT family COG1284 [Mycoplasmopsis pulmonis]